jgi:hypothetical protein
MRPIWSCFLRRNVLPCLLFGFSSLAAQTSSGAGAATRSPHPVQHSSLDSGVVAGGLYRNPSFGFTYKVPFGWVERTAEMGEDRSNDQPTDPSQAEVLLAVFERPPEASGETVNSAVVIAAESAKSYPGLKTAVDYFTPLEEVTKAKGFKVANEPYEFSVGTKRLAREDFSKELGKLTMQQASLVMVQKGYVICVTFIAGSEDDVEELIAGLSFAPILKPNSPPASKPKQ